MRSVSRAFSPETVPLTIQNDSGCLSTGSIQGQDIIVWHQGFSLPQQRHMRGRDSIYESFRLARILHEGGHVAG